MTDLERMEAFRKQMGHPEPGAWGKANEYSPKTGNVRENSPAGRALPGGSAAGPGEGGGKTGEKGEQGARAGKAGGRKKRQRKPEPVRRIPERERTKPNKYENAFMIDLMILHNSLAARAGKARARLEKVNPHGWRDLRLLLSLVERIQEQLMQTMPASREEYYMAISQFGRYHMVMEGPVTPERMVLIGDKHLGAITEMCVKSECVMCLRDGKEIERCPLRETLLEVAPPREIREDGSALGCEYRNLAGQLLREECIEI